MHKKAALALLFSVPFACYADAESAKLIRDNSSLSAKNSCVQYWTDKSHSDILSKFATVSEMCSCMKDEMEFTVSDDLALGLFMMQANNQNVDNTKFATDEEVTATKKAWTKLYGSAHSVCVERFIQRKNRK